jgi:hypothetical protein
MPSQALARNHRAAEAAAQSARCQGAQSSVRHATQSAGLGGRHDSVTKLAGTICESRGDAFLAGRPIRLPPRVGTTPSLNLIERSVMTVASPPPRAITSPPVIGRKVPSRIRRLAHWVGAMVTRRRRADTDQSRFILCLECFKPVELDAERMQRLGGRTFIECASCRNLIWIRGGDLRRALTIEALEGAQPTDAKQAQTERGVTQARRHPRSRSRGRSASEPAEGPGRHIVRRDRRPLRRHARYGAAENHDPTPGGPPRPSRPTGH